MDKITPEQRSLNMAAVKGKNTSPEIKARKILHKLGFRFRLHRKDLPGKPDIVLPKYRLCIFVHGCFWHQHIGCKRATIPESNHDFWVQKFHATKNRDQFTKKTLTELGWHVEFIWECETKDIDILNQKIKTILATYLP